MVTGIGPPTRKSQSTATQEAGKVCGITVITFHLSRWFASEDEFRFWKSRSRWITYHSHHADVRPCSTIQWGLCVMHIIIITKAESFSIHTQKPYLTEISVRTSVHTAYLQMSVNWAVESNIQWLDQSLHLCSCWAVLSLQADSGHDFACPCSQSCKDKNMSQVHGRFPPCGSAFFLTTLCLVKLTNGFVKSMCRDQLDMLKIFHDALQH